MKTKKSSSKKVFLIILLVFVAVGVACWYLYGNPPVEPVADVAPVEEAPVVECRDSGVAKPPASSLPQSPENTPLYFGNPSDAETSIEMSENYLMEKPQFILSYNNTTHNPNWVAWHLSHKDLGDADRADTFRPDSELPAQWYAVRKQDYKFPAYGFDRGHICPSADRTSTTEDNSMTFLMTNMVPQAPDNNRIVWVALEKYERELVLQGKEAYIFAGPLGKGGTGDKGYFEEIPVSLKDGSELSITVPAYTWKILLILPEGEDDFSRISELSEAGDSELQVIAVCVPNEKGCGKNGSWQQYLCSIDYIEESTGCDFFELLPDNLEEEIESRVMSW